MAKEMRRPNMDGEKLLSVRSTGKDFLIALIVVFLAFILNGCGNLVVNWQVGSPTATESFRKQPEPREPHISVSFSGLNEPSLAYVYFRTLSGDTPLTGSHPGNGEKRVVLPENQGVIYIVTAEAEGYVSYPISYTIQLSGTNFYLVENGQATSKQIVKLKFQFTPLIAQPTSITQVNPELPLSTGQPEMKPTEVPSLARSPVIHTLPGEVYETVFSIPIGERNSIQYNIPSCCANIEGPNAIAVLPDNSFLISDPLSRRLLKYDWEGRLQQTIKMDELGIGYVRDMRVKGDEIFLLETGYQNFRVLRLTLDGKLIASEIIPYQFPIDAQKPENTLEVGLTGIAIDCIERIILEVFSGSKLFPLSDVQKQNDPSFITQGLICNGKKFFVSTPGLWEDPQVTAGETIYQTKLSEGLGGLQFLDVLEDGSIYLVRDDVMPINPIKVDQTIHYFVENGAVQGVARVPLSEFYYPIIRNAAVGQNGEVFAMLPRPDSLDIIRLNFYQEMEPLIPGAAVPQITIVQ